MVQVPSLLSGLLLMSLNEVVGIPEIAQKEFSNEQTYWMNKQAYRMNEQTYGMNKQTYRMNEQT
jgi:hypothetical protein